VPAPEPTPAPSATGPSWRHHACALAGIASATLAVYANALRAGFVLDARALVAENPVVRRATAANVWFILTHDYWQPMSTDGLYRPLTVLTYLVDYAVFGYGTNALGYHLENVLLHVACAALVYGLVWRLVGRLWPAVVAGGLFAVHPVTTEAVTYVVGRADLLATLGVLAGMLCYHRSTHDVGRARVGWLAALAAACVVAFFGKETGLVLLPALLLHELAFPAGDRPRLRGAHAVVALVLASYLSARWLVAQAGLPPEDHSPIDNPIVEMDFVTGRLTAASVLGRLLGLVAWPSALSADYSYRQIPAASWPPRTVADVGAVAVLVALALLPWLLVRIRRSHPATFVLAGLAAVALLPTANLLAPIGSIMAERFLYLPLVGIAGLVALAAERIATHSRVTVSAALAVAFLALAVRAHVRNRDWSDDLTLWSATVRTVPESAKAQRAWAAARFAADPDHTDLAHVIAAAERALTIRPDYQQALVDLGSYYVVEGDRLAGRAPAEASAAYARAVAVLERARPLEERAKARFVEKMLARGHARETIPDYGDRTLYNNLSLAYLGADRPADALVAYERSRSLDPANPAHYVDISAVLLRLGRWEDAATTLFEALAIAPGHRDAATRLVEVYRLFAREEPGPLRDGAEGARLDLGHPLVYRHRCRAFTDLAGIFTQAGLSQLAADVERRRAQACTTR
jgi:tetratricopeptide (TPR) repeat protein